MVRNGGMTSRRWRSDSIDGLDLSPCEDDEVHVLAVDDSLVDRKVIEKLLKISSCKVTAVDSGIRALQFLGLDKEKSSSSVGFHELKVDLIITDYCMPGMTGYDLLKKIKESSTFRETPVVIMSSENVVARIHRCLEEGAEDFIVKPVKLSDVKRLRGYMATREVRGTTEEKGNNNKNKRKAREDCESSGDLSTSASSISSSPTTLSPSFSPSPSPVLSILSSPAPCSPSSLVSPTRRLKMSGSD